ncbi:MAG TPA: prepilin peptidase [Vicinamibacterales bacterium]|jgi:leader peptidase (prepilin peptidase)/N-methyltransferase
MVDIIIWLTIAALGLAVGSFLNVCIHRLPRQESLAWPASRCPKCSSPLGWYDNIPLLSYIVLGGRCRRCGARIPVMYPLVELVTGVVCVAAYFLFGPSPLLGARLLFACSMIVLFVIDLQHRILPNIITVPGIVVGFLFSFFLPPGWISSLIGIIAGGGVLLLMAEMYYRLRKEEGLGMGDVKMLAMIGAFLGWKLMLVTLVLSSFLGSFIGIAMIVLKKGDMKYALPFGTFLAIGAIVASVSGDAILRWYLGFY